MNFGKAIDLLKEGKKVSRKGWNGKNQYIELATNISYKNADGEIININHKTMGNINFNQIYYFLGCVYFVIKIILLHYL